MVLLTAHKAELLNYINAYPHRWKHEIRKDWDNPFCVSALRAMRNSYGPTWLNNLTASKVKNAETR